MVNSLYLAFLLAVASNASPLVAEREASNAKIDGLSLIDLDDGLNHGGLNASAWEAQLLEAGYLLEPPEIDHEWLKFEPEENITQHEALSKRDCYNTALVTDTTQYFVDWDVQMSPVVCAVGPMTVSVTEGYSVANSVKVSGGVDLTFVKDKLSSSFGVDYSKTWTTSTLIAISGTIPDGKCGCVIWKPLTTRRYGSVYQGCVGALQKVGTFMADSHASASYNGVSWISGAKSICEKPGSSPPLSRCQGSGNFV